jgi:hypothetical protein
MPDCGKGCEIQTGRDHLPQVARDRRDAMKEFQPSLRLVVDGLPPAYSLLAAVCFPSKGGKYPVVRLRIQGFLLPAKREFGQPRMERHRTL